MKPTYVTLQSAYRLSAQERRPVSGGLEQESGTLGRKGAVATHTHTHDSDPPLLLFSVFEGITSCCCRPPPFLLHGLHSASRLVGPLCGYTSRPVTQTKTDGGAGVGAVSAVTPPLPRRAFVCFSVRRRTNGGRPTREHTHRQSESIDAFRRCCAGARFFTCFCSAGQPVFSSTAPGPQPRSSA